MAMHDMEKILEDFEYAVRKSHANGWNYVDGLTTEDGFKILAILKEQDSVEPFHRCIGKDFSLIEDSHFDYCPYCGKPITWAKQDRR